MSELSKMSVEELEDWCLGAGTDLNFSARLIHSRNELARRLRAAEADRDEWERRAGEAEGLRKLLWLRHGCPISALYGDDGEMQCSKCLIDFKRWPSEKIDEAFIEIGIKALEDFAASQQPTGGEVAGG